MAKRLTTILVLAMGLWMGTLGYAAPQYVSVSNTGLLRATPDASAGITHTSLPGTIFEVGVTQNGFTQILTTDGTSLWILTDVTEPYIGDAPPPVTQLGLALPMREVVPPANDTAGTVLAASSQAVGPDVPFGSSKIKAFIETDLPKSEALEATPVASVSPIKARLRPPPLYLYQPPTDEFFVYPPRPVSQYPQLDVSGYYEMKLSGRDYSPKLSGMSPTDNRWSIIQRDPVYTKLPADVLIGSPKFDMRFRFNIDGKLADDLDVHYDVEQEPDFPGKYDVQVKYQQHELTFYHLDAEFQDGEFINTRKALNGAKYYGLFPNFKLTGAMGKQRSEPKKYESFGNGRKVYNVGVKSLLYDSVRVWVNNTLQTEGREYTVDYYQGDITFSSVKAASDYIEIVYEFTNPIEDFIPVLSKKNFIGAQILWKATPVIHDVSRVLSKQERFRIEPSANASLEGEMSIDLAFQPVVLGTEEVILNGVKLRRNVDYIMKNRRGRISMVHRPFGMWDSVTVNYQVYDAFDVTEDIIAQDSPGPYGLTNSKLVSDSLEVYLDQKLLKHTVDYTYDDNSGKIVFSYPVHYPSIITARYTAIKTEVASANGQAGSPISFGLTYLDESAKGQDTELTLSVTSENITATSNTIYTAQNPIVDPAKMSVVANGVVLSPTEFEVTNAYLGQVRLLTVATGSITPVVISYSYRKSFQTTAVFQGTGEKYYNNNLEFTLRDVPVKLNGIQRIRVYNGLVDEELTPIQDYTVDYGPDGNAIRLTFYKRQEFNPYSAIQSIRTDYPLKGQRITMVYDHAPESETDAGNVSQKQIGMTFGGQLSQNWRFDSEVSLAENNFSKPQLSGEFNGVGQGGAAVYNLGQRSLVENSETVQVDNVPLTKDQQYSINYINGTLRFINLNPQSTNKVRVTFRYLDPNGQTQAGASRGFKPATKVTSEFKEGPWTLRGNFKTIDKDYVPISAIQTRKGTSTLGGFIEYKRADNMYSSVEYQRTDEYVPPTDVKDNVYIRSNDLYSKNAMVLFDALELSQSFRYIERIQDKTNESATVNGHAIDTNNFNSDTALAIGGPDARYVFSRNFSQSSDGFVDGYNRRNVASDAYRLGADFTFRRVIGLGDTYIKPTMEYATSRIESLTSSTGSWNITDSYRRALGVKSRYQPTMALDASLDASTEEQNTQVNGESNTPNRVMNYRFDTNFKPYGWFNTGFTFSNSEEFSPLLGQKGRFSQDLRYRVGTFGVHGLLTALGASGNDPYVGAFKNSFATYDFGVTTTRENDDLRNIRNENQTIAYNAFAPIPGFILTRISLSTQQSFTVDNAQTQTSSSNASRRNYQLTSGSLGYRPPIPILNWFNYSFGFETKRESQLSSLTATAITSNETYSESPYDKRNQKLGFDPGRVMLGIPGLWMIDAGPLSAAVEESLNDSTSFQRVIHRFGSSATQNIAQDNVQNYGLAADLKLKPFNLFDYVADGRFTRDTYSRNLLASVQGLTYRLGNNLDTKISISPFSFITVSIGYAYSGIDQWRSPSLNMPVDTLRSYEPFQSDSSLFTDYLNQIRHTASASLVLTPFSFISVKSGAEYSKIRDSLTTTGSVSLQEFIQEVGTVGVEFRPLPGLSTGYDYSVRQTSEAPDAASQGYTGRLQVAYTPIQTENFKVSFTYTRDDNWGRSLNTLQQNETQNGTGDRIRYQVVDRKDAVDIGSLSVNVVLPFKGNPYLENIVLTGEGQIKRVTDEYDGQRKASGAQQIGYEISGLVLKAAINF